MIAEGNLVSEALGERGWAVGAFDQRVAHADSDMRFTSSAEMKWSTHKRGELRHSGWGIAPSTSLTALVQGAFFVEFLDRHFTLNEPGDFVIWVPDMAHTWEALADSTMLTLRWPSRPGHDVNTLDRSTAEWWQRLLLRHVDP